MGAANQTVDMGMRRVRSSDLGDRRDDQAPLQAAADRLVLGRLSDGHPLQRHLGPAIATPARLGIVPKCLAALWQAAREHGHLQSYLDEFVFRFNRRRTRHAAFRSLLGIAAGHPPLSYNMLISPEAKS